jgi:hypothetical protein
MSQEHSSNSLYGIDSDLGVSENSGSDVKKDSKTGLIYSSGSDLLVTDYTSIDRPGRNTQDSNKDISARTESIITSWSASDDSGVKGKSTNKKNIKCLVPSNAAPFIFDGTAIRYNIDRGVDEDTPVIFGSRKLIGKDCKDGYKSSHMVFDPKTGTFAVGYDVANGWARLPYYSLISGVGNSGALDGSLISGSHNKIKFEPKSSDKAKDISCPIPPSCTIIGGSHNTITNTNSHKLTSAIIASEKINVRDCENTVVIGMVNKPGQKPLEGFKEATITRNLYGIGSVHAGPLYSGGIIPPDSSLVVNGDGFVQNNLQVKGNIDADTITANKIMTNNIIQKSLYVGKGSNATIVPGDGVNIVYANPVDGRVDIHLGTGDNTSFEPNRTIIFKDVTLEVSPGSTNDVLIWSTEGTRIETYLADGGLTASNGGAYKLNSSGGAVTFRYVTLDNKLGTLPTWVIESQFVGNPRLLGRSFPPADSNIRAKFFAH